MAGKAGARMIEAYGAVGGAAGGRLERVDLARVSLEDAVWIDLHSPSRAEEDAVEAALRLDIPTREDMQEIEISSRIYHESDALFLTAQVVATPEGAEPEIGPVTFVVTESRLITVRYHAPRSIAVFTERAAAQDMGCVDGHSTLVALLETLVDRLADILEGEARKLDALSKAIFAAHRPDGRAQTLPVVLQRIGRAEDVNGKAAESLATIRRLLGFVLAPQGAGVAVLKGLDLGRVKTLVHDIQSLQESAQTQERKVLFLLDATLGVISIRQSDIIKIFSVVAFVFLPPTLIASIYGMNFDVMPELRHPWGYPAALGAMVVSAVVPYLIFRWKKWL